MTSMTNHRDVLIFTSGLIFLTLFVPIDGGQCWSTTDSRSSGLCNSLLQTETSREECCSGAGASFAAYTDRELTSGELFFLRAFRGGVPCQPCITKCSEMKCPAGKRCHLREGSPRCVCDPEVCSKRKKKLGAVCGTDGKTYKSVCRLNKKRCQTGDALLGIAYYGPCKDSCEQITCPSPKTCLMDQQNRPHCAECRIRCPPVTHLPPVCGSDGVSYKSKCHMYEQACSAGKTLRVKHQGVCLPLLESSPFNVTTADSDKENNLVSSEETA